ncbi:MAG: CvpA family protein [Clostridium sp.]|nr:CvpA family protein [Clostridium sp.]
MNNWLDIVIIVILLFSAIMGWRRGLVRQFFDVAAVLAAYFVALRYGSQFIILLDSYLPFFRFLPAWINNPTPFGFVLGDLLLRLLGFALLFFLVRLFFRLLAGMAHSFFSLPVLGTVNALGGLGLGLLKGILFALILVAVVNLIGTPFWEKALQNSLAASHIIDAWPVVYQQMLHFLMRENPVLL